MNRDVLVGGGGGGGGVGGILAGHRHANFVSNVKLLVLWLY